MTAKDTHLKAWGGPNIGTIEINEDLDASGYSEALKFSCCTNVTVNGNNHKITGGREDVLDIVRGCDYTFKNMTLIANKNQVATIKCAVSHVVFENVYFGGVIDHSYVILGQYSDYNIEKQPPTQYILFKNCKFENPEKAIRLWYAKNVILENTEAKINKVPGVAVWGYFSFRRLYDRIKYGKAGRSGSVEQNKKNCCQ